jgi:hypothetical protein
MDIILPDNYPLLLSVGLFKTTQPTAHMCGGVLTRSDKQQFSNKIWTPYQDIFLARKSKPNFLFKEINFEVSMKEGGPG